MQKHGNAGGRTPKAAVRALVDKFGPKAGDGARIGKVSGKVLPVVVAGGALVMVGQPLLAGAGPEQAAPHPVQIRAVDNEAPLAPAVAPAPAAPTVSPAPAAPPAPEAPAAPPAPAAPADQGAPAPAPLPVTKSVDVDYQAQQTSYWCGPTAARIALSSKTDALPDQGEMAAELGTTENGTDTIGQVVDGLNKHLAGTGTQYVARDWSDRPLTPEMTEQLWSDTVRNVADGKAMVANIVAAPGNQPPGYPSSQTIYHYVAIVGYNAADKTVHISDPARFSGIEDYWLSLDQIASLIQPKGYAA
ncbi:C39 family peptidase [Saccharopolyspora shandongensis]|uniref:C39 family peptidase n=1 Tax=Saccharopolyspora shandongensis TaxID=418495 RepID=UPI0034200E62